MAHVNKASHSFAYHPHE